MKTCLITGATSGIGLEHAKIFAENNYNLVLVARDGNTLLSVAENLETNFKIGVITISKDLILENSPEEIYAELKNENIQIDVLVNNAGQGEFGKFSEITLKREVELIRLNIESLTKMTNLFLPQMLERNSGKILNIGSVAGFFPGPKFAVYHASKAFVVSFSQSLAEELVGTGVSVSCLCPGLTFTPFFKTAHMDKLNIISKKNPSMMSADKVARIGFNGLMHGKIIIIPGLMNKFFVFSRRFLPESLQTKILKHFYF